MNALLHSLRLRAHAHMRGLSLFMVEILDTELLRTLLGENSHF